MDRLLFARRYIGVTIVNSIADNTNVSVNKNKRPSFGWPFIQLVREILKFETNLHSSLKYRIFENVSEVSYTTVP